MVGKDQRQLCWLLPFVRGVLSRAQTLQMTLCLRLIGRSPGVFLCVEVSMAGRSTNVSVYKSDGVLRLCRVVLL